MDRDRPQTFLDEECSHEIGMSLRTAEADTPTPTFDLELFQGVSGARLSGNRLLARFRLEFGAPPRYVCVVDVVWNAKIVEWTKAAILDACVDAYLEHEVLLAKRQKIGAVGTLWRGCQTKQKLWSE